MIRITKVAGAPLKIICAVDDAMNNQQKQKGFTLLEMLLVLVVISTIIVMLFGYITQQTAQWRRDRVIQQIQQILNAGAAFYADNSYWPVTAAKDCSATGTLSILQANKYLPPSQILNPWQQSFGISCSKTTGNFYVYTDVSNSTDAAIIAGTLPFGYVANSGGNPPTYSAGGSYVVASVTIPGQNLINARAINYAGIYNSGACVPAPVCPSGMTQQIFVTPAAVSGDNDASSPSTVYPISSYTAYAVGGAGGSPATIPNECGIGPPIPIGCGYNAGDPPGTSYWRVCLQVITEKGTVSPSSASTSFGSQGVNMGSIMAITRCAPSGETPVGSPFPYFTP